LIQISIRNYILYLALKVTKRNLAERKDEEKYNSNQVHDGNYRHSMVGGIILYE